jgi:hypothetical protein
MALGLAALAGTPGVTEAAPRSCDLSITVTPSTIPPGSGNARIRLPAGLSDIQVRTSSGTASAPFGSGAGSLGAEFIAGPDSPPLAVVAVVGGSACGFSVVRIAGPAGVPASGSPVTLVVVEPAVARADRDAEVLVYVFAVDKGGVPRRGVAPEFRPSAGVVSGVESLGHGIWRGRWRVPAGETGAVGVEAIFGWEAHVSASLARIPGPPASIEITQDSAGAAGGGGTLNAVTARVLDSSGNLTEASLELESTEVQVGTPVRLERGVYRAPVVVPEASRGAVIAITGRAGGTTAIATFSIAPSAAAAVRVTPPKPIRADGSNREQFEVLEVTVVDALGNPVNEAPVGSGGRGQFGEAFPAGPGQWALPYRPPRVSKDTTEQLTVKAGPASTTVDLELLARRSPFSLGLKAGVAVTGGSLGFAVGGELGGWLAGPTQLGLLLDVSWWMVSRTETTTVGGAASAYEATQNYVPILLSVAWRTPFADRWMLWATLGAGGCVVSNSAQVTGQPTVSESGFAPAASGSISAGPRLGPGFLFLEARATWIGDPKLTTLSGSSTSFLGLLGYRFDVG